MKRIEPADLLPNDEYLRVRNQRIEEIIDLKRRRRVAIGNLVCVVFENRTTVLSQIQEMCRVEGIVAADRVRDEIEVYNALIPGDGELSATLFIEIADSASIRKTLDLLIGLDRPGVLSLHVGALPPVQADWEEGHSEADRIAAVHYVRFRLPPEVRSALLADQAKAALRIEHRNYNAFAVLAGETLEELRADLAG